MKKLMLVIILLSQTALAGKYSRSSFKHWVDEDGDCVNTRHELLQLENRGVTIVKNCKVVSGKWFDEYSGEYFTNLTSLQIDHIVPLKEAWDSGAEQWTPKKRQDFANDYEVLIAVKSRLNSQKGASDPASWIPPRTEYLCEYLTRWIYIKEKYELRMDTKEESFIADKMQNC